MTRFRVSTVKAMKPADLMRELLYPVQNVTIFFAMIFYWLLFGLAIFAGLFGIALLALTLPAWFRFLLYLLEERANNRRPPVPDITMFNPADNLWTLTPLILLAAMVWSNQLLVHADLAPLAGLLAIVIFIVAPASMAILAITHSPAESLNPLAIYRMISACGSQYFIVPAVLAAISAVFYFIRNGAPGFSLYDLGTSYQVVLMFLLTGAVLHNRQIAMQVDIPPAEERSATDVAADLEKQRQSVATHAYGFVSRGNRTGGLDHVRKWIATEPDLLDAYRWFVAAMLSWESKEAALFLAQDYLGGLLRQRRNEEAIKLMSRCLHEDSRWKPAAVDRDTACELLAEFGRDDLLQLLRS